MATVIMIVNYDCTVIRIITYDPINFYSTGHWLKAYLHIQFCSPILHLAAILKGIIVSKICVCWVCHQFLYCTLLHCLK